MTSRVETGVDSRRGRWSSPSLGFPRLHSDLFAHSYSILVSARPCQILGVSDFCWEGWWWLVGLAILERWVVGEVVAADPDRPCRCATCWTLEGFRSWCGVELPLYQSSDQQRTPQEAAKVPLTFSGAVQGSWELLSILTTYVYQPHHGRAADFPIDCCFCCPLLALDLFVLPSSLSLPFKIVSCRFRWALVTGHILIFGVALGKSRWAPTQRHSRHGVPNRHGSNQASDKGQWIASFGQERASRSVGRPFGTCFRPCPSGTPASPWPATRSKEARARPPGPLPLCLLPNK
jgi:hypothetical protein